MQTYVIVCFSFIIFVRKIHLFRLLIELECCVNYISLFILFVSEMSKRLFGWFRFSISREFHYRKVHTYFDLSRFDFMPRFQYASISVRSIYYCVINYFCNFHASVSGHEFKPRVRREKKKKKLLWKLVFRLRRVR